MIEEQNGELIRTHTAFAGPQGAAHAEWAIIVPPEVAEYLVEIKSAERIMDKRDLTKRDHQRGVNFHPFRGFVEKIPQMKADRERQRQLDEQAKNAALNQQDAFKLLATAITEMGKTLAAIQSHLGDAAGQRANKPDASEALGPRRNQR